MDDFDSNERWRPVIGYEGWYEVSDLGRVRRTRRGFGKSGATHMYAPRVGTLTNTGYRVTTLSKAGTEKSARIHRLVLDAFVGPRPHLQGHHRNGNRGDNRLVNLAWADSSDNNKQRLTAPRGKDVWCAKLDDSAIPEIFDLYVKGSTQRQIALRLNVTQSAISAILRRKTYKHVLGDFPVRLAAISAQVRKRPKRAMLNRQNAKRAKDDRSQLTLF